MRERNSKGKASTPQLNLGQLKFSMKAGSTRNAKIPPSSWRSLMTNQDLLSIYYEPRAVTEILYKLSLEPDPHHGMEVGMTVFTFQREATKLRGIKGLTGPRSHTPCILTPSPGLWTSEV